MAVIERFETEDGLVMFCKITMASPELMGFVALTPQEQSYFETLTTEKRRREWLAWHVVLQKYFEGDTSTSYNDLGAPMLTNGSSHISVSHNGDYVAIYHSSCPCGVDIDCRGRDFTKVSPRIATPSELSLAVDMPLNDFLSLVWCAKEAIYKSAGIPGIDFTKDITIREVGTEFIKAIVCGAKIKLRYAIYDNHNIVYTL